ncbi:MAG: sigma-54 dependent transcriptional regulator [Wenzhouxiangellaceae bacterium]|nr:sigma-54 dependent transcriptional regulator [Wenzhouxiangellaceae bacterium]
MTPTRSRDCHQAMRPGDAGSDLIGDSMPVRQLKLAIAKMARTDLPVMLTGETGTGKELVARMLHDQSPRADGPFVAVNCPAVPPDLFQAEVFGYEKGAFTGADRHNDGRIDAARGGTLFLDEIGDLPMDMQAVLLRFLQEGTFERLGSVKLIQADVRILAATHIDLKKAVAAGRFREDLFYRLNALHLHVPPLRDRGSDKILLAEHFVEECSAKLGLSPHCLSADARSCLMEHDWPGNVRELRNRIFQALVLCESRKLTAEDLGLAAAPASASRPPKSPTTLRAFRQEAERQAIQSALRASGGCVKKAAQRLGISRTHLYRLLESQRMSQD